MSESTDIVLVQLDPEAPPGLIAAAVEEAGLTLTVREAGKEPIADESGRGAGLIVLGSAATAFDPRAPALALLRDSLEQERPILALDAGAALLAAALGGAVRAGESHEFNYVDLAPTVLAGTDPVLCALGTGLPFMEWHDDAIDLPDGIAILTRCGRGRPQAFRAGRSAYGLRFHAGATAELIRRWTAIRAAASNNPAIRVRIGAEMVRHQERAERFGREVIGAWLALARSG